MDSTDNTVLAYAAIQRTFRNAVVRLVHALERDHVLALRQRRLGNDGSALRHHHQRDSVLANLHRVHAERDRTIATGGTESE